MKIENKTQIGTSKVKGVNIRYTIRAGQDGKPKEVMATISNETAIIGSANANVNGTFGISLNSENGLPGKDIRAVVNRVAQDIVETFNS